MILRKRLGVPDDAYVATYCGHFVPRSGIEIIVQSAGKCHLFISAGRRMGRGCCQTQNAVVRGSANFIVPSFVPNRRVPEYLKASDVFAHAVSFKLRNSRMDVAHEDV